MLMGKKDYWRWSETVFVDKNKDWRQGDIITCGIDVGSVSTKAVIMVDGKLYAYSVVRTGVNTQENAKKAFLPLEEKTGITVSNCSYIVGTGYGRINIPFAHKTITEIACHGKGASFVGGKNIRTILDMGGQDCKAIHIDEEGKVTNFLMNDKCAAGTGRGLELLAELLEIPIEELGVRSFDIDEEPEPVSNVCVVFARTEAYSLLKKGWSKNKVLAAYLRAIAERVSSLLMRIGIEPEFFVSGGISKNVGIVKRIERIIGLEAVKVDVDTQIIGAIGAAIFAKALYEKERGIS